MKFGLQIAQFNWPGSPENTGAKLIEIAQAADDAGFASLWVMDHFFQMDMPQMGLKPEEPMFDGYTALAYMAAVTKNVRLGTMVTGVNYRHPGHLIKIVTGLDVLSGGRADLGIGAGWYEREALGWASPSRHWPNASSAWRRRCNSPTRCGPTTCRPSTANTTNWPSR